MPQKIINEGIKINKQGKKYVSNPHLYKEILKSFEQDKLTDNAVELLQVLVDNIILKKKYNDPAIRDDCRQGGMLDLLMYWKGFNPEMGTNCFAYYSSIAINGITKVWNKYAGRFKSYDVISLDNNIHSL